MPKPVIVWTDPAIWLTIAIVVFYVLRIRRDADRRRTWRYVTHDAPAMCAAVVLVIFAFIALLDSIHYRPVLEGAAPAAGGVVYSTRTWSVLDRLLSGITANSEKTYSAPLAYRSFVKEVDIVDGREVRDFPRLRHGGAHLTDPASQWGGDVLARSVGGVGLGLAVAMLATLGVAALVGRGGGGWRSALREIVAGETDLPVRPMLITLAIVLAFTGWVTVLWPLYHVFGTDITGNDVLVQTLKSIRTAFVIGTLASAATLPLAVALGILSGYYRGWVDDLIQYLYTVLSSIPSILLIAALVLLIQVWIDKNPQWFETGLERAEFRLFLLCIILGITGWATLCRLLRAETLKLSQLDFVQASRAFGVADLRIMAQHVLPNVMHLVLIVTVLDFSALVLYEAVLSYIGVGVDPSSSSFGSMINLARNEMSLDPPVWWNLGAAFCFMLALVLAANLFSDAVRDAFDPRARALRPQRRRAPAAEEPQPAATPVAGAG